MPRVFVSYRRRESGGSAGRVRDRLIRAFGRRNVFVDVDKIRYGDDFQQAIDRAIASSSVLIAIIGQRWASQETEGTSAPDYVYGEIRAAVRQGIPIVPVLVDEASMPSEDKLPDDLASITRLNYTEIKLARFDADVSELIRHVDDRSAMRRVLALLPPWLLPMVALGGTLAYVGFQSATPVASIAKESSVPSAPLGPPVTKVVASAIIDRILIDAPIARPGDVVTIVLVTNSSQVQASAIFDHGDGQKRRMAATYDRRRGGIVVTYPVPVDTKPGNVDVTVWVQELQGREEERQSLTFEVRAREGAAAVSDRPFTVDGLGFRSIHGGRFRMGASFGQRDERPVHEVKVGDFLLMDHELTFDELQRLAVLHPGLLGRDLRETLPDVSRIATEKPITWGVVPVSVTFEEVTRITDALSAISKRAIRLPTEAEWEYAARGGLNGKQFPWGDPGDVINGESVAALVERAKGGCEGFNGMPVRGVKLTTPANAFGLYDLAGNLWEWTASAYQPYPYSPVDPADLEKYPYRVIRGGGAAPESCQLDVSFRGYGGVGESSSTYGVRLAADIDGAH